jgi:hypothetical protein
VSTLGPPTDQYVPRGKRVPRQFGVQIRLERDRMMEICHRQSIAYVFLSPRTKVCGSGNLQPNI